MQVIKINDNRLFDKHAVVVGYFEENKVEKLQFVIPSEWQSYGRKACFDAYGNKFAKTFDDITGDTITLTRDITQYRNLKMSVAFFKIENDDEIVARTSVLDIIIEDAIVCDDDIQPDDPKVIILDELIQKVEDLNKQITVDEEAREKAEIIRENNEQQRISNEEKRVEAETKREEQETLRQQAETLRESNETKRISSEEVRVSNEEQRISNEQQRITNEEGRIANEDKREQYFNDFKTWVDENKDNYYNKQEIDAFQKAQDDEIDDLYCSVPKATASGEYINIDNAMPCRLLNTEISGKYEQEPSPSPNYPQEIEQISEVNYVEISKNLFDKDKKTDNFYYNSEGNTSIVEGYKFINQELIYSQIYTFSFKEKINYAIVRVCEYNGENFIKRTLVEENNKSVTLDTNTNKIIVSVDAGPDNYFQNLQIEKGSVATSYEPYKKQTINIDLKGNTLNAISKTDSNLNDCLVIDRKGNYGIQKRTGKIILNGSENWERYDTLGGYVYTINVPDIKNNLNNTTVPNAISNRFIPKTPNDIWSGILGFTTFPLTKGIRFCYMSDETSTLEKWKLWLSNNNTEVYYELATPEFIDLGTLSEMPSTFKGINNISVETNIGNTNIDIVYVEDLKVAIDKLQKQIEIMQIQSIETKEE